MNKKTALFFGLGMAFGGDEIIKKLIPKERFVDQSEEDRDKALAKAEAKRQRRASKRLK